MVSIMYKLQNENTKKNGKRVVTIIKLRQLAIYIFKRVL